METIKIFGYEIRDYMHIKQLKRGVNFCGISATILTGAIIASGMYTPAYAITVNGTEVARVADISEAQMAVSKAEEIVSEVIGENYKLDEKIEMNLVIATSAEVKSTEALEEVILENVEEVKKSFILTIDGETVGISDNRESLEALLEELSSQYTTNNTVDYDFEQHVSIEEQYVSVHIEENLAETLEALSSEQEKAEVYTVEAGDTYYELALEHDMTVDDILELNPNASLDSLMIGDKLIIKASVPMLSVVTYEEETYEGEIDPPVEYVDDANLYIGRTEVVDEGEPGIATYTAKITYVDGVETERNVISTDVISEPTPSIVKQGTAVPPKDASTGTYIYPVYGSISSYFGNRILFGQPDYHTGIDIPAPYGTNIKAADGGAVIYSGWKSGYGNIVIIRHDNGDETYYAHNSQNYVSVGERVYQGQTIAAIGSTGISTGNHVHFEIRVDGVIRNPLNYL